MLPRDLTTTTLTSVLTITLSVGLPSEALGQEAVALDPVLGETLGPDGLATQFDGYAAPDAISATRIPVDLATTPRAITVIGTDQIEDQGVRTLEEAITYSPGVTAQTYGQDGRYDQFAIRGFESQNSSIYRDGLPLRTFGFASWRLEPFGTERIEVLRGPTADLYGANEPGGLVNAATKRPEFTFGGEVQGSAFGHGGGELALDVTGPLTDRIAYRLIGVVNDSGTIFDEADNARTYLAPSLTFAVSDDTTLTLHGQYQKDDIADSYILQPYFGTQVGNPLGQVSADTYTGNPNRDTIESEQNYLGYEFDHALTDKLTFRSRARVARNDWFNQTSYVGAFFSSTGTPGAVDSALLLDFDVDETITQSSFDNALAYDFRAGQVMGTVLAGIDHYRADSDYDRFDSVGSYRNFNTGAITAAPAIPGQAASIGQEVQQTGVYLSTLLEVGDDWTLTGNLRHDRLDIDGRTSSAGTTTVIDNSDTFTSGSIGASYSIGGGAAIYANAARSFNLPPSGLSASGQPLEVERSESLELGMNYRPAGTNSLFSVALFDITKNNTTQPVTGVPGALEQVGEVRSRGVELGLNHEFGNGLSMLGSYTYLDAEITRDASNQGNALARVPQHSAALWVNYDVQAPRFEGVSVGAGVRYTGARYSDAANTAIFEVPSSTVFDAAIGYERDNWRATLAARNLTDQTDSTFCTPGVTAVFSVVPLNDPLEAAGCALGAGRSIGLTIGRSF